MTGTIINIIAILAGSFLGILLGSRLPGRLKSTLLAGMGIFTAAVGMQMFLKTDNMLVVLGALILGALIGEWLQIEERLQDLGIWLERRLPGRTPEGSASPFVRGFLAASVSIVPGPWPFWARSAMA